MKDSAEVKAVPENTIIACMWNSQYAKGLGNDDASIGHPTMLKCADVVDQREKTED